MLELLKVKVGQSVARPFSVGNARAEFGIPIIINLCVSKTPNVSACVYVRVDDMHFYVQRFRVPCEFFTSTRKLSELSSFTHFIQIYPVVLS